MPFAQMSLYNTSLVLIKVIGCAVTPRAALIAASAFNSQLISHSAFNSALARIDNNTPAISFGICASAVLNDEITTLAKETFDCINSFKDSIFNHASKVFWPIQTPENEAKVEFHEDFNPANEDLNTTHTEFQT